MYFLYAYYTGMIEHQCKNVFISLLLSLSSSLAIVVATVIILTARTTTTTSTTHYFVSRLWDGERIFSLVSRTWHNFSSPSQQHVVAPLPYLNFQIIVYMTFS